METESKKDVAAEHVAEKYPDFKFDMINGMFLGGHEGKYYFFNKGNIGVLEGEYSVANNISNFFNGALVATNSKLRFIPPKLMFEFIQKVGDTDTAPSFQLPKDFPFPAEALCLETMRRIEGHLPLRTGINGWNHFVILLEKFVSQLGNQAVYLEGIDHYCFFSIDDVLVLHNPETMNFDWQFAEEVSGFKVGKKTIMTLINRQRFM